MAQQRDDRGRQPIQTDAQPNSRSWLRSNGWKIGVGVAALLGLWWNRSRRNRKIDLDRVSEDWLAQQEFEAGRDQPL